MVQKENDAGAKRRGRPRAYDRVAALQLATDTFWQAGYSGTSLDSVAAATGMNAPSLYAAFGNKRAIYLEALAAYWQMSLAATREALQRDVHPSKALMAAYDAAMDIYFSGNDGPRGCFVVGTAVTETAGDPEIQKSVAAGLRMIDADFETFFRKSRDNGHLTPETEPDALAILAAATMQTIAIRARAGVSRAELRKLARKAVKAICGSAADAA